MRAYLITTSAVFGLLVVAHVWRAVAEGPRVLKEPVFMLFTVAAAALFVWAMSLLRSRRT